MKRTIMNGVYCPFCCKEHIHDSDGSKTSELDYFVVEDDSGELIKKVVCAATGVILVDAYLAFPYEKIPNP